MLSSPSGGATAASFFTQTQIQLCTSLDARTVFPSKSHWELPPLSSIMAEEHPLSSSSPHSCSGVMLPSVQNSSREPPTMPMALRGRAPPWALSQGSFASRFPSTIRGEVQM